MKKTILFIGIAVLTFGNVNGQEKVDFFSNEDCYCAVLLYNGTQVKATIKTAIFKTKCPNQRQTFEQDARKQFFYYIHKNNRSNLELFKEKPYSSFSNFNIVLFKSKEEVENRIAKGYLIVNNKRKGYNIITLNNFIYEPAKFTGENYTWPEIGTMNEEIDNYMSKGIEIK